MITAENHNNILLKRIAEWEAKEESYILEISNLKTILEYHKDEYSNVSSDFKKELRKALNYYNR